MMMMMMIMMILKENVQTRQQVNIWCGDIDDDDDDNNIKVNLQMPIWQKQVNFGCGKMNDDDDDDIETEFPGANTAPESEHWI